MTRAFRLAAFAAVLALAAPLDAQSSDEITLETVDSLRIKPDSGTGAVITVTGVPQGQATATTQTFRTDQYQACERMLTLSMERPGRYLVTIPSSNWNPYGCMITRRK